VIVYGEEEHGSGQAAQWRRLWQRGMLQHAMRDGKMSLCFFLLMKE
jgi:hypothetical protein